METNNYQLFCNQLNEAVHKFSNLSIKEKNGRKILRGVLDIENDISEVVGSFLIEIHYNQGFPKRFPLLFEVGDLIPKDPDWHKYTNESCCITVEADEILKCKLGISVTEYIENFAIPFLANFLFRKANGYYKNGEYSHGKSGTNEFYSKLLKTDNKEIWRRFYQLAFGKVKFDNDRNKKCFCGSNLKFKKCHLIIFETLEAIGEVQVAKDIYS